MPAATGLTAGTGLPHRVLDLLWGCSQERFILLVYLALADCWQVAAPSPRCAQCFPLCILSGASGCVVGG
jgi:hypothetical protein